VADEAEHLGIWGDDIGITNLSCYSDGLMGYRTPNIDRIADEGMRFTDSYGEQSCTAGRSAFITGQSVYCKGLSKVGLPGAGSGMAAEGPTIAELTEASRVCDRPVREEPPRRPGEGGIVHLRAEEGYETGGFPVEMPNQARGGHSDRHTSTTPRRSP